jgi:hypothetical protein
VSDEARRLAASQSHEALIRGALVVALERAGGTLAYSGAEYDAIAERFGGIAELGIEVEASMGPAGPQARLTLVRKSATSSPRSRIV